MTLSNSDHTHPEHELRFAMLQAGLEHLAKTIEQLRLDFGTAFDLLATRLERMEHRLDHIDGRLGAIETSLQRGRNGGTQP